MKEETRRKKERESKEEGGEGGWRSSKRERDYEYLYRN